VFKKHFLLLSVLKIVALLNICENSDAFLSFIEESKV